MNMTVAVTVVTFLAGGGHITRHEEAANVDACRGKAVEIAQRALAPISNIRDRVIGFKYFCNDLSPPISKNRELPPVSS